MTKLIIIEPFADYVRGDEITDAEIIKSVLETHRAHVAPVTIPDPDAKPTRARA